MGATNAQVKSFMALLGKLAIKECNNRIAQGKGFVLPSICIAQSALETGYGTAGLMTKAKAFFGIKAGGSWTGKIYRADTWEVAENGVAYNTKANFRAYDSLEDSVRDYYDLIGNNSRYAGGLSYGNDPSKWKTPRECVTAIHAGGYATDKLYVNKIMDMVNYRKMYEYDAKITGLAGDYFPVNEREVFMTFTKDNFLQGILEIGDSGRSIINNKNVAGVALNFEAYKYFNNTAGNVRIDHTLGDDYEIYVARLNGDVATIESTPRFKGDVIPIARGEKIKGKTNNIISVFQKDIALTGLQCPVFFGESLALTQTTNS